MENILCLKLCVTYDLTLNIPTQCYQSYGGMPTEGARVSGPVEGTKAIGEKRNLSPNHSPLETSDILQQLLSPRKPLLPTPSLYAH